MTILIAPILLSVACLGLITSTVFCALVVISAIRFGRRRKAAVVRLSQFYPAISVLKPLHGESPGLERNIESFFGQDYAGPYELLFCARHESDEGLQLARRIAAKYPEVNARFVACGEPSFPNPKVYSLRSLAAGAKHDLFITSDADVRVKPNYLSHCIQELLAPEIDLAFCLYRGIMDTRNNFFSALDAVGKSVEMSSGVLVADMLSGTDFALGPTMILRRRSFVEAGGFADLGRYYADDFVLGNRLAGRGRGVAIAAHVIDLVIPAESARDSFRNQLRWMQSTRRSRPWGHLGTVLTFAMPFGLLGFIAEASQGNLLAALFFFAAATLNRIIQSAVVLTALGAEEIVVPCLMYPLRDLLGSVLWVCSYLFSGTHYHGAQFRIMPDGTIDCDPELHRESS